MTPRRIEPSEESGFSLLEMITAIFVFSIFIGIFTVAVSGFVGSIIDARAKSEGAGTNSIIINNIDREVRYAESINRPGVGTTATRYIEFLLPRNATASGTPVCYQWRYDPVGGVVSSRSWSITNTNTASNISPWTAKGEQVVDEGGVDYPFAMVPADLATGALRQRMIITLSTGIPGGTVAQTETTFVARNSSNNSVTNPDANADGQSDTRVCMQAGGRP
ncbi:MAG: prepilin-type N-terminal cleavage/methylation domain-containing protein [Microbacteriaceae bacterium]